MMIIAEERAELLQVAPVEGIEERAVQRRDRTEELIGGGEVGADWASTRETANQSSGKRSSASRRGRSFFIEYPLSSRYGIEFVYVTKRTNVPWSSRVE